jgi:hypothetical protein
MIFLKRYLNFFLLGQNRNKIGLGPAQIKYKLSYIELDSAQPRGLS